MVCWTRYVPTPDLKGFEFIDEIFPFLSVEEEPICFDVDVAAREF